MSANDDTKLQFNYKNPAGDLFNIYAADEDEAADLLEAFGRLAGKVGEVGALLRTSSGAAQQLSTGTAPAPAYQLPRQASAPAQESIGGAPMCAHGKPMKLRTAKAGAARQWSAWMCDTPQGTPDQCKPIDTKTGKPWN